MLQLSMLLVQTYLTGKAESVLCQVSGMSIGHCLHICKKQGSAALGHGGLAFVQADVLAIPERARRHISELVWPGVNSQRQTWLPGLRAVWPSSG